jgi:hypothetical protein
VTRARQSVASALSNRTGVGASWLNLHAFPRCGLESSRIRVFRPIDKDTGPVKIFGSSR